MVSDGMADRFTPSSHLRRVDAAAAAAAAGKHPDGSHGAAVPYTSGKMLSVFSNLLRTCFCAKIQLHVVVVYFVWQH